MPKIFFCVFKFFFQSKAQENQIGESYFISVTAPEINDPDMKKKELQVTFSPLFYSCKENNSQLV